MALPVIFIDMDGVLSDLNSGIKEMSGIDDLPDRDALFKTYLPAYTAGKGFENEKPLFNSYDLVDFLLDLQDTGKVELAILTSCGDFYHPQSEVVDQKKKFLESNFEKLTQIPFCVTTSGADKAILAHDKAFLIDDHHKNVAKFIAAGGRGIVYHHFELLELKRQIREFVEV